MADPVRTPARWRRRLLAVGGGLGLLLAAALLADRLAPLPLARLDALSPSLLDADGRLLHVALASDDHWRLQLTPEQVDANFVRALIAFEDRRFWSHPGVDPLALLRAAGQWLRSGHVVSGGSTLTMQVVRLLEPRPRTLAAKLIECLRALQLEWHFDKRQILAMYLRLAPYGGNLAGLRAAALAYLGHEPAQLTPAEAALLAVLPQAPTRLRPDRHGERAHAARDKLLRRIAAEGVIDAAQLHEALSEPLPTQRQPLPRLAEHLAARLRDPAQPEQASFVQRTLQTAVQRLADAALAGLNTRANIAVLVADYHSGSVIAYLGAADTRDPRRGGAQDLAQAWRSPGSTLKPAVYGLAFDELGLHPDTRLDDVPTRFGDYQPANFQDRYHGEVTLREALQRSLNVPAVAVLDALGAPLVAARLRQAGIALALPDGAQPGLPLVLGGVGTRLDDLLALYAGIAGGGEVRPLRLSPGQAPGTAVRLLSARAAQRLGDILEDAPPPPEAIPAAVSRQPRRIAYKTGTSYGFRDAWALGFDGRYVVGVWAGRPDGSPSPGRYGRNTAAPLLWQVFDLLPPAPRVRSGEADDAAPERWRQLGPLRSMARAAPLEIGFPPPGARLLVPPGTSLQLAARGGVRPLRWLVDGAPLPVGSLLRRSAAWTPLGAGSARITVIDAQGQSASAEVWVEP